MKRLYKRLMVNRPSFAVRKKAGFFDVSQREDKGDQIKKQHRVSNKEAIAMGKTISNALYD